MLSKKKVNRTRTHLLLLIDHENQKYIKNSKVKLNHLLPCEIQKNYEEFFTISFDNPVITQANRMSESNNHSQLQAKKKKTNSLGVNHFLKHMKEMGRDFIECRKMSIGSKKLESFRKSSCIGLCSEPSQEPVRKTSSARKLSRNAKLRIAILMNEEEKEELKIEKSHDILIKIASKLKSLNEVEEQSSNISSDCNEEFSSSGKFNAFKKYHEEILQKLERERIEEEEDEYKETSRFFNNK